MQFGTFISLIAAVGIGTIIAAVVSHRTAISNHRQAWINALRNDLAEYFKALQQIHDLMPFYLQDSQKYEGAKAEIRTRLFFVYERIRLRLNINEKPHVELERKLHEFLDEPIHEAMAGRKKIDEAVELARKLLKREWEVTKHPWKARGRGEKNRTTDNDR
jgi:hypothetical protein